MTKQEIKALVAAKIAGQGSQVDVGGALPTVLENTLDLIPDSGGAEIYWVDFTKDATTGAISAAHDGTAVTATEIIAAYNAGKIVKGRSDTFSAYPIVFDMSIISSEDGTVGFASVSVLGTYNLVCTEDGWEEVPTGNLVITDDMLSNSTTLKPLPSSVVQKFFPVVPGAISIMGYYDAPQVKPCLLSSYQALLNTAPASVQGGRILGMYGTIVTKVENSQLVERFVDSGYMYCFILQANDNYYAFGVFGG